MVIGELCIKISTPWWIINLYIPALVVFCKTCESLGFNVEPDMIKITDFMVSHIKTSICSEDQ